MSFGTPTHTYTDTPDITIIVAAPLRRDAANVCESTLHLYVVFAAACIGILLARLQHTAPTTLYARLRPHRTQHRHDNI